MEINSSVRTGSSDGRACFSHLEALEYTLAQQRKSGPSIHHPLDELDPGHLPFHLSVVMRARQSNEDGGFVPFKSIGKTMQFWDVGDAYLRQPGLKLLPLEL